MDVLQAWEDVTTPAKHSQSAPDCLSQQGCNKDSRAQRWGHTPWRPQSLPDQPVHGSTEVGDQNKPLPTLTTAAIVRSALDDPLPATGASGEFRARGTEGDVHYCCRPAGAHGQQLKGPGLKPATGTSGEVNWLCLGCMSHPRSDVHVFRGIKRGQLGKKLIVQSASLSLASVSSRVNWGQ